MANRYQGAEQQSWWNELQSADYLFRWGETRTSPSWALFVLCKLSTCSFRAPRVGNKSIQLEWFIFRWTVSFIVLCVFIQLWHRLFVVPSFFQSFFPFYLSQLMVEGNDAQSESFLLILKKLLLFKNLIRNDPNKSEFTKAASMFSKPAEVQGRAKFSLGSVFICGSRDREARKLSEARGREATIPVAFVLGATAAVLLRFGSPNKNITLRKKEE